MKVLQLLLQLLPNGSTTINYGGLASRQVLTPSSVLKFSGIMPFVFYHNGFSNNFLICTNNICGVPLLYLIELVGEWTPCGGYDLWGQKV